jgi:hypothetical protein
MYLGTCLEMNFNPSCLQIILVVGTEYMYAAFALDLGLPAQVVQLF